MATVSSDSSSKDGRECSICLDAFISPRQLPCLHSFCEHCLQDHITKKTSRTIGVLEELLCPVCRAASRPEESDKPVGEWASLFPVSPISLMVESKVKVERLCDICSSRKSSKLATKVCIVCEEAMCDDCSFAHQTMKISRNHKMLSVEELEIDPRYRIRLAKGFGCPAHQDKEIEFYCKIHEAACCGTCSFLHHKTCKDVTELKTNLTNLLKEMNSQKIMEELITLEGHLTELADMNKTNICILESQVNDLTSQICEIRKKINAILDDMEKRVKCEGDRIYKEKMIRKQEQNYQCQSLTNAIRNSHALLETVSRLGTDTQKFLVTRKTMKHLPSYSEQIREKFQIVDSIKIMLEFDSHLTSILSQDGKGLVKIVCKEESEILQGKGNIRPLRKRMLELSRVINVSCPSGQKCYYTGVTQLHGGEVVLVDCNNKTCCLCDSSYNFITMYRFPERPYHMCLIDDHEIAVTIPKINTVQIFAIKDSVIRDAGKVTTRYPCYGVAAVSNEEIVVSGQCGGMFGSNKCYWSLISKDGRVQFCHEFDCHWTDQAYIALSTSKSRVYICVCHGHAVYCFSLIDGRQYFVYTSDYLKSPLDVAVDREDNVYVVGYGSNNIHKLSSDGVILQLISSGVPKNPSKISILLDQDQFILTNGSEERTNIHHFIHK